MFGIGNNIGIGIGGSGGSPPAGIPVNTAAPVISGVPFAGGVLTISNGTWDNSPSSYLYQWKNAGVDISGATNQTYTVLLTDELDAITCVVTATNVIGSASSTSSPVTIAETILYLDAASPSNTTVTVNQTFTTSDVDVAGNKINLTGLGFDVVSTYDATPVMFSSTGILPSPLVANQEYYAKNVTGGIQIFKRLNDSDFALLPGFIQTETIPPASAFGFDIPVVLTNAGSGTHTIYTNTLAATIADISGNNSNYVSTQINKMAEIKSDEFGQYFNMEGVIGYQHTQISEPYYGKGWNASNAGLVTGNKRAGKRLWGIVTVMKPNSNAAVNQKRIILNPSRVNAGTGVFTTASSNGHGMGTGDPIDYGAFGSSSFPTPVSGVPSHVRTVSTNAFTLHPTALDATNNTNIITYSDTGVGLFYVVDKIQTVSMGRQILYDGNQNGNGHDYSPGTTVIKGNSITFSNKAFNNGLNFFNDAGANGDLAGDQLAPYTKTGNSWTKLRVKLFIPSGSLGWVRQDTGLRITSGTYWITRKPSSQTIRLHDTEAAADASIGVATLTANCIKYVTTNSGNDGLGSGSGALIMEDQFIFRQFDDGVSITGNDWKLTTADTMGVYTNLTDFTGNGVNRLWYGGVNNLTSSFNASITNRTTGVIDVSDATAQTVLCNAYERHVPGYAKIYETIFFVGTDVATIQSQMQMAVDALKTKYGIA